MSNMNSANELEFFLTPQFSEQTESETVAATRGYFEVGTIAAYLLRGVIYRQDNAALWNSLIEQQGKVQDFVLKLGVKLVVDDNEGYAYLRSLTEEEMPDIRHFPPKLMTRRQLSFNVSFLLLLLRHKLVEFDSESNGDTRLVLSATTLSDLIQTYYGNRSNEVRLQNQIEAMINKVVELGFLKPLQDKKSKGEKYYEVKRILKAYFDAQTIADFKEKLLSYQQLIGQKDND
ncbi:MAG: DUF4194 domain-containing protein [Succinivibrio sp.]|nr:DUF4194 domain-containing protein [Succinivibrio sp.]